jgi:LEA14-like dessication related protein
MSKVFNIILMLSVLVLGGCETLNSLMQYEKPTASLNGVSFGEVSLESAQLLFDVDIKNPYALGLPLLNVDYDLKSDGNALLNGTADVATTIPAKSTKAVTLPVNFKYLDLLKALTSLKDVRPGSQIPYAANVGLSVDSPMVGTIRLPLTKEGMLNVPMIEDAAGTNWMELLRSGKKLMID